MGALMFKGMTMYEVWVDANSEGEILIGQPKSGTETAVVSIAPEQVDTLISWLKAMRDEVLKTPDGSESGEIP